MNKYNANNRTGKYISWITIIVLAGCSIYFFVAKNKAETNYGLHLTQKQQIIDSVKADRNYLQTDFDAASAKIDLLMSKNLSLNDSLRNEEAAIVTLRKQIRTVLSERNSTQADFMKARNMLYLLISKMQEYELYIAELEGDNKILTRENKLLSTERDQTVENNIALKMAGSILHASNVRMELIHARRNGMEKATSKAKKVDRVRIMFDIDQNRIAESGTKQIYVRIIAPDEKVLYAADISGKMNTIKGDEIVFSIMTEVDLVKNQPLKNIIVDWTQKDVYPKGIYATELYHQGYKIGEKKVELR